MEVHGLCLIANLIHDRELWCCLIHLADKGIARFVKYVFIFIVSVSLRCLLSNDLYGDQVIGYRKMQHFVHFILGLFGVRICLLFSLIFASTT